MGPAALPVSTEPDVLAILRYRTNGTLASSARVPMGNPDRYRWGRPPSSFVTPCFEELRMLLQAFHRVDLSKNWPYKHQRKQRQRLYSYILVIFGLWCLYRLYLTVPILPTEPSGTPSYGIPPTIWQIYFGYKPFDRLGETIESWVRTNQDYSYKLVSDQGANEFVEKHYADRPEIMRTFLEITYPVFRADFLRYMLLESEGGVYSDIDTTAKKPIRDWVPSQLHNSTRAIVGIEYDQLEAAEPSHGFAERMAFCQWTMAASKGHPMLRAAVEAVSTSLNKAAEQRGQALSDLQVLDGDVGLVTGPGIWTTTVFESLSIATGTNVSYRNITGMKEPRLFGDILVVPVDGFGSGQPHSGSSDADGETALVRHQWTMSWRKDGSWTAS